MLNQPSTWCSAYGRFYCAATGLALFAGLLLGCPGPEPSASGAGGTGAVGNGGKGGQDSKGGQGGQGGEDKGSVSNSSTGPNLGGEGGGGMSSNSGMNSGGEGGCGGMGTLMNDPENCGECGFDCSITLSETVLSTTCLAGVCTPTCAVHQHDFVPDSPLNEMSWGCETPGRRVFVTKQQLPADMLEGVAGADEKCQMIADAKGLGGTWKAWLSDEQHEPLEDFEQSPDPYYLLDGTPVAEDFGHLVSVNLNNPLLSPINRDQDKMLVPNGDAAVWTGTSPIGVLDVSCGDWGLNPGLSSVGRVGNAHLMDVRWTFDGAQLCINDARLYCFEQ